MEYIFTSYMDRFFQMRVFKTFFSEKVKKSKDKCQEKVCTNSTVWARIGFSQVWPVRGADVVTVGSEMLIVELSAEVA